MNISKLAPVALASFCLWPACARAGSPLTAKAFPLPPAPEGLRFELRLPEGKTQFQMGETIPVRLLFSNVGAQTLKLNVFYQAPPSLLSFAGFKVEPKEGTSNPLGDLPIPTGFSFNGYIPPPVVLSAKPTEVPLLLNEFVRFDRPGTYSVRATTGHIIVVPVGKAPPNPSIFFGGNAAATSSPVSIQIVPADPKWQAEQVVAWRKFWSQQKAGDFMEWETPAGVHPPANDLRFLNTRATAQAMIDRLGQDEFPRSSGSEAGFWRLGLIGFSDRAWLVEAMKNAMKRPDYPVTQGFLDTLETLQGLQSTAKTGRAAPEKPFFAATQKAYLADWNLAFDSLTFKNGRARALTVHSLLETAWLSSLQKEPEVQKRVPRLVAQVPDIFSDLPPVPQEYLLDDDRFSKQWSRIKSPRLSAPLRRAWRTVPHSEGWGKERGNLILRRLLELDPKTAHALILKEMADPNPRVSFKVLSLLPDKRLPQLQKLWLSHLNQNSADQNVAALLIGRYATQSIRAQVKAEYVRLECAKIPRSDLNRGLSRYLARVK